MHSTVIVRSEDKARRYWNDVIAATNEHRDALGFLPFAVYESALIAERLWIAAAPGGEFLGHLLFGGQRPTLKIKQLFVAPAARRQGVARQLINELITFAERNGYGSIRARVAEDLEANAAWEHLGFDVERRERGGETTGRTLAIRFRRLQPVGSQLHFLSVCDGPSNRLDAVRALGLPVNRADCFTLDLNVWLDFVRKRDGFDAARQLMRDAFHGRLRLWFTCEAQRELIRTSRDVDNDPLLRAAMEWPILSLGNDDGLDTLIEKLRATVFPLRSPQRRGAENDLSDLRHLAISIQEGARGFITRERALLRARDQILTEFGLEVLAPSDVIDERELLRAPPLGLSDGSLKLREVVAERPAVRAFIAEAVERGSHRLQELDVDSRGHACFLKERLVGIIHWRLNRRDAEVDLILEGADTLSDEARQRVFDILIGAALFDLRPANGVKRVILQTDLDTHSRFSADLERVGFFATSEMSRHVRFLLGPAITVPDWRAIAPIVEPEFKARSEWLGAGNVQILRLQLPDGHISFDRFAFESHFGILAESLRDRRSWLVPIRQGLRDELLPLADQTALLRSNDASYRVERVYFRAPKRVPITRGDIILFYVSKPTKGIIGLARCTASSILDVDDAARRFGRLAVIKPEQAAQNGRVHCIAFDNYEHFPRPLGGSELKRLNCWPKHNMVSVAAVPLSVDLTDLLRAAIGSGNR